MSNIVGHLLYSCLPIAHSLLGGTCLLCCAPAPGGNLCRDCHQALPRLPGHRCPVCALPTLSGETCGSCLADPPQFQHTRAALAYRFPADRLIQAFKYGQRLALADTLASLMTEAAPDPLPDCLIPVPLARQRLQERGFNQAMELARRLARRTGVRLAAKLCERTRHGPPQVELPWKERAKNIRGAFACRADLAGKRVAIVDDVMTTGATLHELAGVLRRRGAREVTAWVVARTLREK